MTALAIALVAVGAAAIVAATEVLRRYAPGVYFAFSEIVHGIPRNISWAAIVIRFTVPLVVGAILGTALDSDQSVISSAAASTGALLLVWPVFLRPEVTEAALHAKRTELLLIYTMFVATYTVLGLAGGQLGIYLREVLTPVFGRMEVGEAAEALKSEVMQLTRSLIYMVIGALLVGVWNRYRQKLQDRKEEEGESDDA